MDAGVTLPKCWEERASLFTKHSSQTEEGIFSKIQDDASLVAALKFGCSLSSPDMLGNSGRQ